MSVDDVVIVSAVRTPMGKRNGSLSGIHPVTLGAQVLTEVVGRAGINKDQVEYVVFGCVSQVGEQSANVGRNAMLAAGFPYTIPATSVDLQCGSSQQALHFAANLIQSGVCDVAIAGGVESMSRVPMGSSMTSMPDQTPFTREMLDQYELTNQGISAEKIAKKWGISREDCDRFGARSQQRAAIARAEDSFVAEITPVKINREGQEELFSEDEGIRPGTTPETLATLKPSFLEDGVLHAGNSSQITDGAAAVLLMSAAKAHELGITPRARIVAQTVVGSDPELMLTGPIGATEGVLKRAGLTVEDINRFEINEAFAPVVLAWEKELHPNMDRVNVNGGAIALGHPLGCTGARLMTTLLYELERSGSRYGLQTMCCGGGLGTGTIIERISV
ncbi:MAG TPA: thiolase family protein [Dehalococcoidia bacterium]